MTTKEETRERLTATAQDPVTGELPEEALAANQLFTPEQLPDPANARAAGLPETVGRVPAHLVVDEDDPFHPLAPEPGYALRKAQREGAIERLRGWTEEAEDNRGRVGAQPKPDEISRRVQGASHAQGLILAGEDPDKAQRQVEQEHDKADKQIEKSASGDGSTGNKK